LPGRPQQQLRGLKGSNGNASEVSGSESVAGGAKSVSEQSVQFRSLRFIEVIFLGTRSAAAIPGQCA